MRAWLALFAVPLLAGCMGADDGEPAAGDDLCPDGGNIRAMLVPEEPGAGVPDGEPPAPTSWTANLYRGPASDEQHIGTRNADGDGNVCFLAPAPGQYRLSASTSGHGCPFWSGMTRFDHDGDGTTNVELRMQASCAIA